MLYSRQQLSRPVVLRESLTRLLQHFEIPKPGGRGRFRASRWMTALSLTPTWLLLKSFEKLNTAAFGM